MNVNKRMIERITQKIIDMLDIEAYLDSIDFNCKESIKTKNVCGYMEKDGLRHKIVININECRSQKEIIHTIAHELRHVWQSVKGFDIEKNYEVYRQTYNTNIYEIDADRFADMIISNKRYKANKDGLYITNINILKHKANIITAKAIA